MNNSETRYLGLDIGTKRIGLALTDSLKLTAQPFGTLEYNSKSKVLKELKLLVSSKNIEKIIVGLPIGLDGLENEQCKFVREFISTLCEKNDFNTQDIIFRDERLTSVQAGRVIKDKKLKNKERRKAVDRIAASIILSDYLSTSSY